jgi:starch phosphorylase
MLGAAGFSAILGWFGSAMSFRVHPIAQFLVRPALPPGLDRLPELGMNLLWSWNHSLRAVFRRLDAAAWKASNFNPVVMLGRVPQHALERAAADPRFLALYHRALETCDHYRQSASDNYPGVLVAYFSMEYGLLDCMPIYSGGLGVLSADHLRASSDALFPLVGVGLLYQKGYLIQTLDPDGWQIERSPVNDFYSLPITPVLQDGREVLVPIRLGTADVFLKVWRIDAGRVKVFLLDSNIPQNPDPAHRDITGQLYSGDLHRRICQEIALGIGGLRALKAVGLKPTVFHMNEGHSAFLAIERVRVLMAEEKLTFEEALEASRRNNVFTTHTSVPAGIDLFDSGLLAEYFHDYCREAGIPFEALAALGRHDPADPNQPFSMAVAAFRTSNYRNAVSRLHRQVSQQMWEGLWPGLPVSEVPIISITNGVHLPFWINGDFAALYDQYLQPDWRERHSGAATWQHVAEIPDAELWEAHRRRKRRLINFVRERAVAAALARQAPSSEIERLREVLDPEVLTIGFARRFATYKRATLIFRDPARLGRLLTHPARPVQILIAGKAHPLDGPGKSLIREIVSRSREPDLAHRIVFVEDYGIQVAREMVGGVDVWLNTPRRGEEACGTSGMKAGMNGALNFSILDGWFDEAAAESGGWAVGGREPYSPERDDAHAAGIYSLLENEIAPMFYEGREQGIPVQWMRRMKQSLRYISAQFNSERMVGEYAARLYQPAHAAYVEISQHGFRRARERAEWNRKVADAWPRVRFVACSAGPDSLSTGSRVSLRARLDLGGLCPDDVRVEVLVGHVGPEGELQPSQVLLLQPRDSQEGAVLFECDYTPPSTGRLGVAMRVCPNHFNDPLNRPCNALMKWAQGPAG